MTRFLGRLGAAVIIVLLSRIGAWAQIDPVKRQLLEFGYNAAFEGHAPLSAYAFYYWNHPEFFKTNITMRVALGPTYVDSELGIRHALGENTDVGLGLAGGAFGADYNEIRQGQFIPEESFTGFSAEGGPSIYHLFNPGHQIPLNGVFRVLAHYATYERNDNTAKDFQVPEDEESLTVRAGLRFGGKEPALFPDLAMELSVWYEGNFRLHSDRYGVMNDREIESHSHLFWAQALLIYTLPSLGHTFYVGVIGGGSLNADRLSAYRLGGYLPLIAEFPLTLPGYYYQELTAKNFALFGGNYLIPFDEQKRWNLQITAATAYVDYLDGLSQPGHWNSGAGAGLLFKSKSWRVLTGYAYGVDAIRTHGRGANSVQLLLQVDLEKASDSPFNPVQPNLWQGMQRMFGMFGL